MSRRRTHHFLPVSLVVAVFCAFGQCLEAQESLRMSLAGAEAAQARRDAASRLDYSNLKLGPTAWSFGAGLGLEANDNIRLESAHARSDLIFHPQVNADMLWRLSDVNAINLGLGAGYSAYVEHSAFNRLFLTPGSELSLDLYAGDFWVNLHDRFSINENSYQDPTVVGSGDSSQLINAAGLTTTWDLNRLLVKVGYDHLDYVWLQGAAQSSAAQPSGESEVFSSSAAYTLRPGLSAGLELGASLFHYSDAAANPLFSDGSEWSAGGFSDVQLSQHVHGHLSAGYTVYSPNTHGLFRNSLDFSGVYLQAGLAHSLNRYVSYTLSGGRTINFAFYGGTIDMYSMRWQANWHLVRKVAIGTSMEYEHGSQLLLGGENFDRYGPGMSLARSITEKVSGTLAYQFYWRDSDLPGRDYAVNVVTLELAYRF